ncbi:hypothetical protein AVEN_256097-1 [Araneus ventricosus]|uniref:Uncharacterized protein n=1 Tax=Araneus ventricosus TaxID=182803 RepID=A0A4Y2D5P3_ARAVE|nr:hypothetical protein AVEN_256097-1 [Araneus ventricosus]
MFFNDGVVLHCCRTSFSAKTRSSRPVFRDSFLRLSGIKSRSHLMLKLSLDRYRSIRRHQGDFILNHRPFRGILAKMAEGAYLYTVHLLEIPAIMVAPTSPVLNYRRNLFENPGQCMNITVECTSPIVASDKFINFC